MVEIAARRQPELPESIWMTPVAPAARFAFHADAAARAAAGPVWGTDFSGDACRAIQRGSRAALWLGPDEYLLIDLAPSESAATTMAALEAALGDLPHALVDISHRQFALNVHGPHATDILRAGCPLDLDLEFFPVGMCTRTVLAKAEVVLWRTAPEAFHVEAWRSFAGYVTGLLNEFAAEFQPER